jgi:hypothetical protein
MAWGRAGNVLPSGHRGGILQQPRFRLVVECACGRRYFRCHVTEPTDRVTRSFCVCGELLGAANGPYSFRFESEDETRRAWRAELSTHC